MKIITFLSILFYKHVYLNPNQLIIVKELVTKKITQNNYEKAYFASGCFWCVEAIYESVKGVIEVYSGYAGGITKNPNYYQIGTGRTGHAEAVEVIYDPNLVTYATLVQVFFGSHDPTTQIGKALIMVRSIVRLHFTKQKKKKYYREIHKNSRGRELLSKRNNNRN